MRALINTTLCDLQAIELEQAARVVSCGMRDNPVNVRAFRIEDTDRRSRALARFFGPVLRGLHKRGMIKGAFRDNALVRSVRYGSTRLVPTNIARKDRGLAFVGLCNRVGTAIRVLTWTAEWARRDLTRPHWHLGPVAVDPHLQGHGIGGAMLSAFCERMDQEHRLAYLETDKLALEIEQRPLA